MIRLPTLLLALLSLMAVPYGVAAADVENPAWWARRAAAEAAAMEDDRRRQALMDAVARSVPESRPDLLIELARVAVKNAAASGTRHPLEGHLLSGQVARAGDLATVRRIAAGMSPQHRDPGVKDVAYVYARRGDVEGVRRTLREGGVTPEVNVAVEVLVEADQPHLAAAVEAEGLAPRWDRRELEERLLLLFAKHGEAEEAQRRLDRLANDPARTPRLAVRLAVARRDAAAALDALAAVEDPKERKGLYPGILELMLSEGDFVPSVDVAAEDASRGTWNMLSLELARRADPQLTLEVAAEVEDPAWRAHFVGRAALWLAEAGRPDEADRVIRDHTRRGGQGNMYLIDALVEMGEHDRARELARRFNPSDPDLLTHLADRQRERGELDEAMATLALEPRAGAHMMPKAEMAVALTLAGRTDDAARLAAEAKADLAAVKREESRLIDSDETALPSVLAVSNWLLGERDAVTKELARVGDDDTVVMPHLVRLLPPERAVELQESLPLPRWRALFAGHMASELGGGEGWGIAMQYLW